MHFKASFLSVKCLPHRLSHIWDTLVRFSSAQAFNDRINFLQKDTHCSPKKAQFVTFRGILAGFFHYVRNKSYLNLKPLSLNNLKQAFADSMS
jgi:hypothetical protein